MWFAYAIAASVVWGLDYALLERLFQDRLSPMFLISMQMAVGAVIIGLAGILTGDLGENLVLLKQERASWTLIGVSVSAFVVGNYLIAISIKGGSAVTAGLVEISYPLFIALFSVVLLGTGQLTFGTVIGGGLILVGALVLKLNH
jgi:drug/metabolite transporter (DMT)-like permease